MSNANVLESQIRAMVVASLADSSENYLRGYDSGDNSEPAWGAPIVGFAAGDDPLFEFLKQDIGEFYWTPVDPFLLAFGDRVRNSGSSGNTDSESLAAQLSVVSWVLPQTEATKADQRRATRYPANRWVSSRAFWGEVTRDVHATVIDRLAGMGIRAVAPEMSEHWSSEKSAKYGFASRWSQRHTAYVAGLGTFGLSDGLITPVGVAMRAGSVVVEAELEPTPRLYQEHMDYCPFFVDGSCGECISRCPAGAITRAGHDKVKCEAYLRTVVHPRFADDIGARESGCGLCQVAVQCESGIPPSI